MIHVVAQNETLNSIAAAYSISEDLLIKENGLENPGQLVPGQTLLVLMPEKVYPVQAGDTLYSIARRQHVTVDYIYRLNPWLQGLPNIIPGQQIILSYTEKPSGSLIINAYAYPYGTESQLRTIVPTLSAILPFSWGFTTAGELIPLADESMRRIAGEHGTAAVMVLTPLSDKGVFNNQLITAVLQDRVARSNFLANIMQVVQSSNYAGVDIDFEYIKKSDSIEFIAFCAELAAMLHRRGRVLSIALAPKTYADQPGLLYEGHDYRELGKVVDLALLMTYEWGYAYGPPMAVSPVYEVEKVINYALAEMPADKILMGTPSYGYDWTLPISKERPARSISTTEAYQLAWQHGAAIEYDELSQAPFFTYQADGQEHIVWFEDLRSLQAMITVAQNKKLRGLGVWTANRRFPAMWLMLSATTYVEPFPMSL